MSAGAHLTAASTASTGSVRLLAGLDAGSSLPDHLAAYGRLPTGIAPHVLLEAVEHSGLLGRGGAGFPTARKMRTVAAGRRPVVVANGCEGEPAAAKDGLLLTRVPHLVLDGIELAMTIVGAREAHLAVHRGSPAESAARRALAERPKLRVALATLPRRYVASEETALIHWLNGGDAKPTFTPPRPFESGVNRRPTLVNNVETLAHLALIARHGPDWFRQVGDHDEPGTLLVTVSGPGGGRVVEIPMGTTVHDALAAGGVDPDGLSAVLVGGYFGTWLPAAQAHWLPLTHRGLRAAGGALGAGIVVGLPHGACGLAETARVAAYLAYENAGQCGPCLNGLPAIAGALGRLATGSWDERFGPALDRWLAVVPGRGACRHPDGATRLVASALQVFADDVTSHRRGRPCTGSRSPGLLPLPDRAGIPAGWR